MALFLSFEDLESLYLLCWCHSKKHFLWPGDTHWIYKIKTKTICSFSFRSPKLYSCSSAGFWCNMTGWIWGLLVVAADSSSHLTTVEKGSTWVQNIKRVTLLWQTQVMQQTISTFITAELNPEVSFISTSRVTWGDLHLFPFWSVLQKKGPQQILCRICGFYIAGRHEKGEEKCITNKHSC